MGIGRTMDQAWKDAISAGLKASGKIGHALDNAVIGAKDKLGMLGSSSAINTSEAAKRASVNKNRTLGGKLRMASGNAMSSLRNAPGTLKTAARGAAVKGVSKAITAMGVTGATPETVSKIGVKRSALFAAGTAAEKAANGIQSVSGKARGLPSAAASGAKQIVGTAVDRFKAKGSSSAIRSSEASKRSSVNKNRSTAGKLRMASGNVMSKLRSKIGA